MDYNNNNTNNNLQNAALLMEEQPTSTTRILHHDDETKQSNTPSKHKRLKSLDIVRGFTIALMIFVDDITTDKDGYPHINHSPWNNITLADFVMPWFLFMVGCSMAFSMRKFKQSYETKIKGTKYALTRAIKLYFLGVLLQGGGFFRNYNYGYDLSTVRLCGILNRIGFAYFVVAMFELWLPNNSCNQQQGRQNKVSSPHLRLFLNNSWKWFAASVFLMIYLCMVLFTYVPNYKSHFKWEYVKKDIGHNRTKIKQLQVYLPDDEMITIECNNYGYETIIGVANGTPECSAIGVYDRAIFKPKRLRTWMSTRLSICSSCSPANCPKPTAPEWCGAYMYDPEGFVATINTVTTTWIGLHFGLVLKHPAMTGVKTMDRLFHWYGFASFLIIIGLIIHVTAFMPMNKQLWSLSYSLFMSGTCGFSLAIVYTCLDVDMSESKPWKQRLQRLGTRIFKPLQCMGMNAILVFCWHGPAEELLQAVYITTGNNPLESDVATKYTIMSWFLNLLESITGESNPNSRSNSMLYVCIKITIYFIVTVYLANIGYFWKV